MQEKIKQQIGKHNPWAPVIASFVLMAISTAVAGGLFSSHLLSMSVTDLIKDVALIIGPTLFFWILAAIVGNINLGSTKYVVFALGLTGTLFMPLIAPFALAAIHQLTTGLMTKLQIESIVFFVLMAVLGITSAACHKAPLARLVLLLPLLICTLAYFITSLMRAGEIMATISSSKLLHPLLITGIIVAMIVLCICNAHIKTRQAASDSKTPAPLQSGTLLQTVHHATRSLTSASNIPPPAAINYK
jgi:hypothetical protein